MGPKWKHRKKLPGNPPKMPKSSFNRHETIKKLAVRVNPTQIKKRNSNPRKGEGEDPPNWKTKKEFHLDIEKVK